MVENQTEKKVKKLHTDNGMEFCSKEFNAYCKSEGIVRHYIVPYTPQQNSVGLSSPRPIACCLMLVCIDIFGLKLPLLAILLIMHLVLQLIRKLQLRYGLVLQLIIRN
jgi:hypothetical protein